ncbi:DUF956 family protein [Lactobacillus sp. ESL0684]|uniref:DUF956 family protein n=1 Tax=unclassified Lactobacillus TaxID=2620435 RepID=UPI0023F7ECE1|nr:MULTISPECIES: DUF956 family protein [unclassified Lactobacillus]WEV39569.1 DUF956 family protein [Lactobacillus sp. ESL0681]WEV43912.1 DUF956 family protein [Lactobacillus sp. ESL0684]
MVKSSNAVSELSISATWFRGVATYGKVMIGDHAFEFYNDRHLEDYVQIPWDEITYVVADVHFGGHYIPRFELRTKSNGTFIFSTRKNKQTLHAIRNHFPADKMRKSLTLWQKIKANFTK